MRFFLAVAFSILATTASAQDVSKKDVAALVLDAVEVMEAGPEFMALDSLDAVQAFQRSRLRPLNEQVRDLRHARYEFADLEHCRLYVSFVGEWFRVLTNYKLGQLDVRAYEQNEKTARADMDQWAKNCTYVLNNSGN